MATTPTESTTTPPSTPVIHVPVNYDNLNESWCELQYKSGCSSTGSISHLHHSVNPEILEKLLQEAQRESMLALDPSSSKPFLPINKSSHVYCDHHLLDSSTPILVDLDTCCSTADHFLIESNLTSPIKLIDSPSVASDDVQFVTQPNDKTPNSATTTTATNNNNNKPLELQNTKSYHINTQSSTETTTSKCSHCARHQKQIDILLEKQIDQEKILINLRKEYEQKLLTKSPEFMLTSSQSSVASSSHTSDTESDIISSSKFDSKRTSLTNINNKEKDNSTTNDSQHRTLLRQNSSTNTLIATNDNYITNSNQTTTNLNNKNTTNFNCNFGYSSSFYNYNSGNSNSNNQDWMKYWSSRPQSQPPKEWNFVHPNSAKSKLRKTMENNDDMLVTTTQTAGKILTRDNIGKLIFTHMASFIVGATFSMDTHLSNYY